MNILVSTFCALILVVMSECTLKETTRITQEERKSVIAEAIAEAKEYGKEQSTTRQALIQRANTGKLSSGEVVGRLFKKPTDSARRQGEARLRLDDMVRRAERKLAEAERKAAGKQTPEAKAEALAQEVFHKPGSMLTSDEITLMTQESECGEIREAPEYCPIKTWVYRTIDGTCNNLNNTLFGAAETAFTRIVPPFYEDGIDSLRGDIQATTNNMFGLDPFDPPAPSARLISKTVIFRNETREEDFSHLLMQWGQFLDHDLDLSPELEESCSGCRFTDNCRPIRIPLDDTVFGNEVNRRCLRFARSLPACPRDPPGSFSPREQLNTLTSFIDGSNVYGSNERVGNAVRLFEDGLLREGPSLPGKKPSLPIDTERGPESLVACMNARDCYLAGDFRANEQISLTIMHTLWFREHNRIARELKQINPFWNDERLFQESRKIVSALLQKITYQDYLPKVMGTFAFNVLIGIYRSYDSRVDPGVPNSFATAAYQYGHSLVRPAFGRFNSNFQPIQKGPLPLVDAFFNPEQFNLSMGTDPIMRGWITERVLRADSEINNVLRTQLFERRDIGVMGTDLAALNIQRGRDHGLPPFSVFVNFCQREFPILGPSFGQFQSELDKIHFMQLHGSLNDVDPWIGGLAERRLLNSFIGPTFACIFGITFSNVRNGDRFWYQNPDVFTLKQRLQIQRGTISRVICDNSDGINEIQLDAFRTSGIRFSCDLIIPTVNLEAWREETCFVGVTVKEVPEPLEVTIVNRPIRSSAVTASATTEHFTASSGRKCIAIACPTLPRGVIVNIETNIFTSIRANGNLPSDVEGPVFVGTWPRNLFIPQNGLFRPNDPPCTDSDVSAITVTPGVESQEENTNRKNLEMWRKKLFETDHEEDEPTEDTPTEDSDEGDTDQLISQLEQALNDLKI